MNWDELIGCLKKCKKGVIIYGIIMLLGALWGLLILISKKDPLDAIVFRTTIFETLFGEKCCSGWPITHFLMYILIGIVSPECWPIWIVVGVVWEVIEYAASVVMHKKKKKGGKKKEVIKKKEGEVVEEFEYGEHWWAGSYKDIIFNTSGLAIGIAINFAFSGFQRIENF